MPTMTPESLRRMAEAQNWRCCYCGGPMEEGGKSSKRATFEHVIPRHLGGADNDANLVISCTGCNTARGFRMFLPHWQVLGFAFASGFLSDLVIVGDAAT